MDRQTDTGTPLVAILTEKQHKRCLHNFIWRVPCSGMAKAMVAMLSLVRVSCAICDSDLMNWIKVLPMLTTLKMKMGKNI